MKNIILHHVLDIIRIPTIPHLYIWYLFKVFKIVTPLSVFLFKWAFQDSQFMKILQFLHPSGHFLNFWWPQFLFERLEIYGVYDLWLHQYSQKISWNLNGNFFLNEFLKIFYKVKPPLRIPNFKSYPFSRFTKFRTEILISLFIINIIFKIYILI